MEESGKSLSNENNRNLNNTEPHSAGATVIHHNPFENLQVNRNTESLTREFIEKWARPFYMSLLSPSINDPEIRDDFTRACKEIDGGTILSLLGDFNWRTRIVGSYFAALKEYKEVEDTVGKLLLKSEVCYAGIGHCIALASFATEASRSYLKQYLDYYLTRKDLGFEQSTAMAALYYIDENEGHKYMALWRKFIAGTALDLEICRRDFSNWMGTVNNIRNAKV